LWRLVALEMSVITETKEIKLVHLVLGIIELIAFNEEVYQIVFVACEFAVNVDSCYPY